MKKKILFVSALAVMIFASCESEVTPPGELLLAGFEENAVSPMGTNMEFKLDTTGTFKSGWYIFKQTAMPSSNYYSCNVVSNHRDTTFNDNTDGWKSIAGGAYEGNNYVVWNQDYYGPDTIKLQGVATVPGFYVTNSVYSYSSITRGDDYSGPKFAEGDWFMLTITGFLQNDTTGTVEFYLAKDTMVVNEWTYVDLRPLGRIDGMTFSLTGSRTGQWGLNTPAYFCYDNLGAVK